MGKPSENRKRRHDAGAFFGVALKKQGAPKKITATARSCAYIRRHHLGIVTASGRQCATRLTMRWCCAGGISRARLQILTMCFEFGESFPQSWNTAFMKPLPTRVGIGLRFS